MLERLLNDKRKLLFLMSMCVTIGGWAITLENWKEACVPAALGGLLILLGNNVFANMIRNVGLIDTRPKELGTNTDEVDSVSAIKQ